MGMGKGIGGSTAETTPLLAAEASTAPPGIRGGSFWNPELPNPASWVSSLGAAFGMRFIGYIFFSLHMIKGLVMSFLSIQSNLYVVKHVNAGLKQRLTGCSLMPFAVKPWLGLATDTVACCGYHKSVVILLISLVGGRAANSVAPVGAPGPPASSLRPPC